MANRDIPPPSQDDFVSLVSRSNPASGQYQTGSGRAYAPAGTYPPPQNVTSPRTAQPMDPFFDDDEEDDANPFGDGRGNPFTDKHAAPGNSAGNAYAMSTPSLGLTANAVPPTGASRSTVALSKDGMPPARRNIAEGYPNNYVSTSKYNIATFIPKFLVEQFSKYTNLFFLFTAFIQQVPSVSPTNRYTAIAPLSLVMLTSAFKKVSEDLKRHQSDARYSILKPYRLYLRHGRMSGWATWFDSRGLSYIETSNLDGETNLIIKQVSHQPSHLTNAADVFRLAEHLRLE
ncbi:hypothetical protein OPQ81_010653 [Rhizoctonia solani]|nr:hypothetical protein OPQ81_010653 [Rhizoctonia solani]